MTNTTEGKDSGIKEQGNRRGHKANVDVLKIISNLIQLKMLEKNEFTYVKFKTDFECRGT